MAKLPDAFTAFAEAGDHCISKSCKAEVQYVVMSDEYQEVACGRHLTTAIDAVRRVEYPQRLQVMVFIRP